MAFDTSSSPASPDWASVLEPVFARCEGAYADVTLRGYRRDLEIFAAWCSERGEDFMPSTARAVARFIDEQVTKYSYATIKRRISAIQFLYRLSDVPSPVLGSDVYLALRRAGRTKGRRPKQARGLTAEILEQILEACPPTLSGVRDAALISVGYDTLCRSAELVWIEVGHVDLDALTVYIPRAKNDPFSDGRIAGITERTAELVAQWLEQSSLKEGTLFRGLHTAKLGSGHLDTSSIRRIIKMGAKRAGLDQAAAELSGHSMRIGGAQDLMTAGHDTLAIMTAGGWKNVNVVARYVEKAALARRPAVFGARSASRVAAL
jgi:integrase/recombinase XerD